MKTHSQIKSLHRGHLHISKRKVEAVRFRKTNLKLTLLEDEKAKSQKVSFAYSSSKPDENFKGLFAKLIKNISDGKLKINSRLHKVPD